MRPALALTLLASLSAFPALAAVGEPSGIPPRLRAGPNEQLAFHLTGNGVNVYQCKSTVANPNVYAWYFVAPDATLYDGSHEVARMASPNQMEALSDTTSVSGFVRAAQSAGPNDLPWMRASALANGDAGLFAGVTSYQRVNTRGGAAPATGCNADNVGEEARIAFDADFYFYRAAT